MHHLTLNREDIAKAQSFASAFINKEFRKSVKDFGSTSVPTRKKNDMYADTVSGKLGEIAFQKFCVAMKIEIDVDFSVVTGYANTDDGQDINSVNGKKPLYKFDIKEAKKYAQWLLVESHKKSENIIQADVYILVLLDLPQNIETDPHSFNSKQEIKAHIAGFAYQEDFQDDENITLFRFKKGRQLVRQESIKRYINNSDFNHEKYTRAAIVEAYKRDKESIQFLKIRQKADLNYGLPVFLLRKNKNELIEVLVSQHYTESAKENIIKLYLDRNKK